MIHSKLTPKQEQENSLLIDIIVSALTGMMKSGEKVEQDTPDKNEGDDHGCMGVDFKYLLNQAIRQYHIPSANWHNSDAALSVWKSICDKEIYGDYREKIDLKKGLDLYLPTYMGAAKDINKLQLIHLTSDGYTNNKGKTVALLFNNLFLAEHLTPVSDVILALRGCYNNKNNKEELRDSVKAILDKMHVARILKIEDRLILRASGRIAQLCDCMTLNNGEGKEEEKVYAFFQLPDDVVFDILRKLYYSNEEVTDDWINECNEHTKDVNLQMKEVHKKFSRGLKTYTTEDVPERRKANTIYQTDAENALRNDTTNDDAVNKAVNKAVELYTKIVNNPLTF